MGVVLSNPNVFMIAMCFASAAFYVAATVVMKLFGGFHFALLLVPIAITFFPAAWFEVMVLRDGRLGQVFLLIFAFEIVITAFLAFVVLRETYTAREVLGLVTIVIGIALMFHGGGTRTAAHEGGADQLPTPKIETASMAPMPG